MVYIDLLFFVTFTFLVHYTNKKQVNNFTVDVEDFEKLDII